MTSRYGALPFLPDLKADLTGQVVSYAKTAIFDRLGAEEARIRADPAARNEAGSIREMRAYIEAGIDGFFTDDPALGRRAVDAGR